MSGSEENVERNRAVLTPTLLIRRMYWADWGNHPKIETAAMDGTMRETLVEENIQWPTGKA